MVTVIWGLTTFGVKMGQINNTKKPLQFDKPTKDELIDMLEDAKEHFDIKRRECKHLRKELKALKQAFDELNASHETRGSPWEAW